MEPPVDNSYALRSRKFDRLRVLPAIQSGGYNGNLKLLTPVKWFPNSLGIGRTTNENHLFSQVKGALRRLNWNPTHIWINQHEAARLVEVGLAPTAIYDITDDWTKFSGNRSQLDVVKRLDAELCTNANHVIVCSDQLFIDKGNLVEFERLHLIPNGVHIEHYQAVTDRSKPLHSIAHSWQKPVFGYTGTIHGDRVDVGLLAHVALNNQHATIAMVGPNLLDVAERRVLSKHTNVIFAGAKSYSDLPDIMRAFDVCIVPHVVTPFTESLNPIKLWEYLAAGKPIVSTNVAGFRDFPELVHVSDSSEEFLQNLGCALDEGDTLVEARQFVARQHSWQSRINQVVEILEIDA